MTFHLWQKHYEIPSCGSRDVISRYNPFITKISWCMTYHLLRRWLLRLYKGFGHYSLLSLWAEVLFPRKGEREWISISVFVESVGGVRTLKCGATVETRGSQFLVNRKQSEIVWSELWRRPRSRITPYFQPAAQGQGLQRSRGNFNLKLCWWIFHFRVTFNWSCRMRNVRMAIMRNVVSASLLAGSAVPSGGRVTGGWPGLATGPGCHSVSTVPQFLTQCCILSEPVNTHQWPQWPLLAPSDNRDIRRTWGWSPHRPWPWPWSPWRSGWTRSPTWWVTTSRSLSRVWSKQRKSASACTESLPAAGTGRSWYRLLGRVPTTSASPQPFISHL